MGGFDYKVSQDSCHCSIMSLNWKMRIYYKVQAKSFQTEEMQHFYAHISFSLVLYHSK